MQYIYLDDTTKTRVSPSFDKHLGVEPQTKFVSIIYILTPSTTGKIRIQVRTAFYNHHASKGRQLQCKVVFSRIKKIVYFIILYEYKLTSRAMLLKASSSAENRSFRGALFLPVPCVPMLCATAALSMC